jgi:hypothetical protein
MQIKLEIIPDGITPIEKKDMIIDEICKALTSVGWIFKYSSFDSRFGDTKLEISFYKDHFE